MFPHEQFITSVTWIICESLQHVEHITGLVNSRFSDLKCYYPKKGRVVLSKHTGCRWEKCIKHVKKFKVREVTIFSNFEVIYKQTNRWQSQGGWLEIILPKHFDRKAKWVLMLL